MKILFLDTPYEIYLVPRIYPASGDNLVLVLRNEITNAIITPAFNFTIAGTVKITITDTPTDFKSRNKYEIELINGTETIYRGKLQILDKDTNIQNFEYASQENKRFDYK